MPNQVPIDKDIKGLFFALPSLSVANTLTGVLSLIGKAFDIKYYNTSRFRPTDRHEFEFREYPVTFDGYSSDKISHHLSYLEFGELLTRTADSIADFVIAEVAREKPDFVMYSHLAPWGRLVAAKFEIPAIALFTTFVLDKDVMFPIFREMPARSEGSLSHLTDLVRLRRRIEALYKRFDLEEEPDIWELYVNRGHLNISFALEVFQPRRERFNDIHFVGYPSELSSQTRVVDKVYVSMGTVYYQDPAFYQLCIDVIGGMGVEAVISVGHSQNARILYNPHNHISVSPFVNQRLILEESTLFLTHGGMASVHEAIYAGTPMIVLPTIPEQEVNARTICELGIGIRLDPINLTHAQLRSAIDEMWSRRQFFAENIADIVSGRPETPSDVRASEIICDFVHQIKQGVDVRPDRVDSKE